MHLSARILCGLLLLASPAAFAQASATVGSVPASARIYKGITLTLTNPASGLSFGDIFTDATGGTVTLSPTSVRSTTGPVLAGTGIVSAASFDVTGKRNATYAITLPSNGTVSLAGPVGSTPMPVSAFTASAAGTLSAAGAQSFTVGASLSVGANQTDGDYNGTFSVTVAYN